MEALEEIAEEALEETGSLSAMVFHWRNGEIS